MENAIISTFFFSGAACVAAGSIVTSGVDLISSGPLRRPLSDLTRLLSTSSSSNFLRFMERVELRRIDMAPADMGMVGGVWWRGAEGGATGDLAVGVTVMDGEVEDGPTTAQIEHDSN